VIFKNKASKKLYREGSTSIACRDRCIEKPDSLNFYKGSKQSIIDQGHCHFECLIEATSRKQMYREA